MLMTALEMEKGTATSLTTEGLLETWNQHGHGPQTEMGSNLTRMGDMPTLCYMDMDMRQQPSDTALRVFKLGMNQRGQCHTLLAIFARCNITSFYVQM